MQDVQQPVYLHEEDNSMKLQIFKEWVICIFNIPCLESTSDVRTVNDAARTLFPLSAAVPVLNLPRGVSFLRFHAATLIASGADWPRRKLTWEKPAQR